MKLIDIVERISPPRPWAEGDKIPWNDPAFSQRMLREHLCQGHDAASRRFEIIDRHINWIHTQLLSQTPSRILDLGCGPGLYTSRLAALGHECVGIDFSPASVAYAREAAERQGLSCRYLEADIRQADYGTGYDLAMLIYGEINVFRPGDARRILEKLHQAVGTGGTLLLEPHTFAAVRSLGEAPTSWVASTTGLFSEAPHLCLRESFWEAENRVAVERYFVVEAHTGQVARYSASVQAYTDQEYSELLEACGFGQVTFYPSLTGGEDSLQRQLIVIVAKNCPLVRSHTRSIVPGTASGSPVPDRREQSSA